MNASALYRLGMVPHNSVENQHWKWWSLTYSPPSADGVDGPLIGFFEGFSPHDKGGEKSPALWLTFRMSSYEKVGDRLVEVLPAEGWFERLCQDVGCPWFFPMVQRMAAGEVVPLREIEDAYAATHHGWSLPLAP